MKHAATLGCAFLLTLLPATGCYESIDVTWYETGVYKGSYDPLLERLTEADLQKELVHRLQRVQTDR
jgi:hypothetical protein